LTSLKAVVSKCRAEDKEERAAALESSGDTIMCARSSIGRKEFAVAAGLWAFLLAPGAARSAGLEAGSGGAMVSPDASVIAVELDSCAIHADTGGGVRSDRSGEERAASPYPAGADEPGASGPVARAGDEELSPSEVVPDPSLDPGSVRLTRALAARIDGAYDQKVARAAEGALASFEAGEAERVDKLTQSAAGRVEQYLAGVVERLMPESESEEFVIYARRVSRSSADAAAGTESEITAPASVDESPDAPSTIAVGVAHGPAIAMSELPLDMDAWCRGSTRGR
jgi:hypothetical protein